MSQRRWLSALGVAAFAAAVAIAPSSGASSGAEAASSRAAINGDALSHVGGPVGDGLDDDATAQADLASVAGSYALAGAGPDGVTYKGTAKIESIAGEMYKGKWTIGTEVYQTICIRDADILSCAWSDSVKDSHDLGVMAYLVDDDDALDGVWFEAGGTALGHEVLASGNDNLVGSHKIKVGENPDKSKYTGTCDVSLKSGVLQLDWTLGKAKIRGLGIRNGDVVSVGFSDAGGNYGVLQYKITKGGKVLTGQWSQTGQKVPGTGTETMTRASS